MGASMRRSVSARGPHPRLPPEGEGADRDGAARVLFLERHAIDIRRPLPVVAARLLVATHPAECLAHCKVPNEPGPTTASTTPLRASARASHRG